MPAINEPRQREVRVFISSTFRDMHAERDHLVTVVFPELRERVEKLGLEFFDVDLRWGVPEKNADGEKANSWEYCRQWIDRVEPFFVCILGQRYGWVPAAKDFKSGEDKLRQESEPRSITDLEVRHAVLDDRKKRRSYFYLREAEAPATATEYVDPPPLSGKLEQLKKDVRSCGRPVRDYPSKWAGSEFSGMDDFGRLVLDDLWSGVLRDERYVSKDVWRQVLGTGPDADPGYTDESEPIPFKLWEQIISLAKPEPKDPLDAEREQMATFAAARLRWFQGRTEELKKLLAFIRATDDKSPRLAVVAAQPGQGKSALLAKLSTLIPDASTFLITHFVGATDRSSSAHALVERLVGELDRSGIAWPEDRQEGGQEPKRDFNSLCLRLAQRLGGYAGERRITILIDALNQLTDGHDLHWLPSQLGPGVRVIVSCVDDSVSEAKSSHVVRVLRSLDDWGGRIAAKVLRRLSLRRPNNKPDVLLPRPVKRLLKNNSAVEENIPRILFSYMPAPLQIVLGELRAADVHKIVVAYLREFCHELDRQHLDALCHVRQTRNPLYLLVMLNELRTLGGDDLNIIVPARIASMSRDYPDTVALFQWALQRLEVFGTEAVRWWCVYLAYGRAGMASHELADLLARKLGPNAATTALLIERGIRRYLLRRGEQLDFFHGQLRQAVMARYGPRAEAVAVHGELADYFRDLADPAGNRGWRSQRERPLIQLLYHSAHAHRWDKYVDLLRDLEFVRACYRLASIDVILADADMARRLLATAQGDCGARVGWQLRLILESESLTMVARGLPALAQADHFEKLGELPPALVHVSLMRRLHELHTHGASRDECEQFRVLLKEYGRSHDELVAAAVYMLAPADPSGSWNLACGIRDTSLRGTALVSCLRQSGVQPERITAEVERITNEYTRGWILRHAARHLITLGGARFCAWTDSLFKYTVCEIPALVEFFRHCPEADRASREAILEYLLGSFRACSHY